MVCKSTFILSAALPLFLAACTPPVPRATLPTFVTPVATSAPRATASPAAIGSPTTTAVPAPAVAAWPVPDWQTSSPEAQGMDSAQLVALLQAVRDQKLDLHSLLVVRHGVLVLEAYFHPYTPATRHALYSATKSVTSALIGLAIAEGKIP